MVHHSKKGYKAQNLFKAGMSKEEIRYIFGGDLLGQLIATTFGILEFEVPFFLVFTFLL